MAPNPVSADELIDLVTSNKVIGTPYVDHTTIPEWGVGKGWDCSSFTSWAMKKFGVNLPAYSDAQFTQGTPVDKADLQVGDLVFFHPPGSRAANKKTGHVGIYIGNGKMVNAANPSSGTTVQPVTWDTYVGARRFIPVEGKPTKNPVASPVTGDPESDTDDPVVVEQILTAQSLAEQYNVAWDFVRSHKPLLKIFNQAIEEDWLSSETGKQNFVNALQNSAWYKENNEYARNYLLLKSQGGADFEDQMNVAKSAVQKEATRIGAVIDDATAEKLAEAYQMGGWYDTGRGQYLTQALTGQLKDFDTSFLNFQQGGAATLVTQLKQTAAKNGVQYDDGFYQGAATAIISGFSTVDTYLQQIRDTAASRYPVYADRIRNGENASDIASPYINTMQDVLGLAPGQVTLDTPEVKAALGQADPVTGKPAAMGMYEYEQMLRKDPRVKQTKWFEDNLSAAANAVFSTFGVR